MAKSSLITYALLGGAAYVAYSWWKSQPTSSSTSTTGGGGSTGTTGTVAYVPPTTLQQLNTAAGSPTAMLNADEWSYYWTTNLGKPAIDGTTFTGLFFPTGRPADSSQAPTMSATAFLAAIAGKGLSGLSGRRLYIPVPRLGVAANRGFGGYGIADFRKAGRR